MALLTTAYTGSADIDPDNIDALLNQLLPDGPLGMVFIPEGTIVKRNQPGLVKVVDWLQNSENGVGVEGTIPVKNLVAALLERNSPEAMQKDERDEPDELVLAILYNPASGLDVNLAKQAHDAGIRVVDLSAAGDDLIFDEPEVPVAGEEENPPWEGDKPPADAEASVSPAETPAQRVSKAQEAGTTAAAKRRTRAPEPTAEPVVHTPEPEGPPLQLIINVPIDQPMIDSLARAIVAAMGNQAQAVVTAAPAAPLASVTPIGTTGGNKADPAGQPEGTAVYYYNENEGKYRPARGTKRRGEERVYLTPDDITQAKAKGMIG
jgi:hypothetical protein